jgi:ubiquinone/menaquinone biosynthesis C-methylase UbiE
MAKKGIDKKQYDRIAKIYDLMESPMELLSFARWRSKVIDKAYTAQTILEVGKGTGKNLRYYNENQQIIAVDISKRMLK